MTHKSPLWLQNSPSPNYPASADRTLITTLLSPGVIGVNAWRVTPRAAGANMSVDISAGTGVVAGSNSGQGNYLCTSDAADNVAIAAAPASGQSRIDLVVATVRDSTISGSDDDWIVQVVTGTPTTGTPVVPSAPASSLPLAQVLVAGGVSSIVTGNVTDLRVLSGSPQNAASDLTVAPSFDGQLLTVAGAVYVGVSGAWSLNTGHSKIVSGGTSAFAFASSGVWKDVTGGTVTIAAPGYPCTAVAQWSVPLQAASSTNLVRCSIREGSGSWTDGTAIELDVISGNPYVPAMATTTVAVSGAQSVTAKTGVWANSLGNTKAGVLTLTLYPT